MTGDMKHIRHCSHPPTTAVCPSDYISFVVIPGNYKNLHNRIHILLSFTVCNTVKITNLKVPSTYIIENTPATAKGGKSTLKNRLNHLILDCEYEIDAGEQGFVLKWLLNNHMIYQWIPTRTPFAVSSFKGLLNTTYRASEDDQHRHRAMAVTRPMWNISGEYACSVHTFQSEDKKSAFLQIIGEPLIQSIIGLFLSHIILFFCSARIRLPAAISYWSRGICQYPLLCVWHLTGTLHHNYVRYKNELIILSICSNHIVLVSFVLILPPLFNKPTIYVP